MLPPLVVVSSNRSEWIRNAIDEGVTQLGRTRIDTYDSVSDLRALGGHGKTGASPPLYAPSRAGANRGVYVVVHDAEYLKYRQELDGTGITVVGWRFTPEPANPRIRMSGFGASRFAAMQFCKTLRAQTGHRWNSAWLLDDNVVALGGFPGFARVEGALPGHACAGFHGSAAAWTPEHVRAWAVRETAAGRGVEAAVLPAVAGVGLIQQAALWNIEYFTNNHLNFGPAFIASAEDISIGNYFNTANIPYQYYNGIGVIKEETWYDDSDGARQVKSFRENLAKGISEPESVQAPMVSVQPLRQEDGGEQPLGTFIVERVLPDASAGIQARKDDRDTRAQARCQAVEQLVAGALGAGARGAVCVDAAAISAIFKINGDGEQAVTLRDTDGEAA